MLVVGALPERDKVRWGWGGHKEPQLCSLAEGFREPQRHWAAVPILYPSSHSIPQPSENARSPALHSSDHGPTTSSPPERHPAPQACTQYSLIQLLAQRGLRALQPALAQGPLLVATTMG